MSLDPAWKLLQSLMRQWTAIAMSDRYAPSALRTLRQAAEEHGGAAPLAYLARIAQPSFAAERDALIDRLTIGATWFFREQPSLDAMVAALQAHADAVGVRTVRVWSAGCATGQEAYTVAMMLLQAGLRPMVAATDINSEFLRVASAGRYSEHELRGVPPALLARYFRRDESGRFEVAPELRGRVSFARANLMTDPPPYTERTRFDAVICRNVLIYFDIWDAMRIVHKLEQACRPGGHTLLGAVEQPLVGQMRGRRATGRSTAGSERSTAGSERSTAGSGRSTAGSEPSPAGLLRSPGGATADAGQSTAGSGDRPPAPSPRRRGCFAAREELRPAPGDQPPAPSDRRPAPSDQRPAPSPRRRGCFAARGDPRPAPDDQRPAPSPRRRGCFAARGDHGRLRAVAGGGHGAERDGEPAARARAQARGAYERGHRRLAARALPRRLRVDALLPAGPVPTAARRARRGARGVPSRHPRAGRARALRSARRAGRRIPGNHGRGRLLGTDSGVSRALAPADPSTSRALDPRLARRPSRRRRHDDVRPPATKYRGRALNSADRRPTPAPAPRLSR